MDIKTTRLFAIIIATLLAVGCNKELPTTTPTQYPIILSPSILSQELQTKYTGGTDFETNDQISVYTVAWTTENAPTLSTTPTANNFHNAKFKRDNTYFNFEATSDVTSVGFPPNGSSIDIYGIYPYNATPITSATEYAVSTPTDQSTAEKMTAGDFLMAKKSNIAPQLLPINLEFNHMMAKLYVNISVAQDYIDKNVQVTAVKFMAGTEAKINISTQSTPNPIATETKEIKPLVAFKAEANEGCIAEAILAPQKFAAADISHIAVTMSNGKIHNFAFATALDLAFNTITELSIKVSSGATNAITIGEAKITNWATGAEINPTDPVNQNSQNKFVITANGDQVKAATVKYVTVSTLSSTGEKRTYELPANYTAASPKVAFEFRGIGNRPNIYPFTITGIKYYTSAWAIVSASSVYAISVTAANQEITQSHTF